MKKLSLVSFLLFFLALFAFGQSENQEEIDYLLFLPNSAGGFVNETQAMTQLDNLARYLSGRNLTPGQIYVYGYAAFAINDIDPLSLSRDRALFVINELQKRGVSRNLFSDPVGYGSVNLWGGNTNEEDRSPNRRVRVVLDGNIITPETIKAEETQPAPEPEITISSIDEKEPIRNEAKPEKTDTKFPWWLLLLLPLLLIIAALIYLLSKRKKSPSTKPAVPIKKVDPVKAEPVKIEPAKVEPTKPEPVKAEPVKTEPAIVEPEKPEPVKAASSAAVAISKKTVNLDEEIRLRAYELYVERGYIDGNMAEDWYKALVEVCAKYESAGGQTYFENEYWWACY